MKRKIQLLVFILSVGSLTLRAQDPPSIPFCSNVKDHGPVSSNATLGGSLTMFLVLGAAFGLTKIYRTNAGNDEGLE
ncbi:MAG: hypothetical protein V1775_09220 [Bacteroidota bacterium]